MVHDSSLMPLVWTMVDLYFIRLLGTGKHNNFSSTTQEFDNGKLLMVSHFEYPICSFVDLKNQGGGLLIAMDILIKLY